MEINNQIKKFLWKDVAIIMLSIVLAVFLIKTNIITDILTSTKQLEWIGSFIAGIFFTSVFTTAPAIVTLGEIARSDSIVITAVFGAIGAIIGDLIIFRFMRDSLSEHLMELAKQNCAWEKIKVLLRRKYFRWLTFLIGGLIIASPLPDELGISLLGFSKMKTPWFVLLSFVFNFIGILLIGFVAKSL